MEWRLGYLGTKHENFRKLMKNRSAALVAAFVLKWFHWWVIPGTTKLTMVIICAWKCKEDSELNGINVQIYAASRRTYFNLNVNFPKFSYFVKKIPKPSLNEIWFDLILGPSFMLSQAIQNELSANHSLVNVRLSWRCKRIHTRTSLWIIVSNISKYSTLFWYTLYIYKHTPPDSIQHISDPIIVFRLASSPLKTSSSKSVSESTSWECFV